MTIQENVKFVEFGIICDFMSLLGLFEHSMLR